MKQVQNFLSLVKFSHTIFALPFALIGFFWGIAEPNHHFNSFIFILVLLDMLWARNAAMAFNRYTDRQFDASNERTEQREIPSGKIKPTSALIFIVVNITLFLITTYFINPLCFYLAPVALLVILGYSYTKRFTPLCHLILGVGLGLAPVGAFMAVTESTSISIIYLALSVFFWVSGFDIIYALQDEEFDREQGLKSIPVLLGKKNALMVSRIFHLLSATFILAITRVQEVNYLYYIGCSIFILALIRQQSIVKHNDLSKVNLAFFTYNGIASFVFGSFTILNTFLS